MQQTNLQNEMTKRSTKRKRSIEKNAAHKHQVQTENLISNATKLYIR